jgi:transposase InsO family protein
MGPAENMLAFYCIVFLAVGGLNAVMGYFLNRWRNRGYRFYQIVLHADNGALMKGKVLSQLLVDLGIPRNHSRPHTSDDNLFREAQFKTMKYHPDYPDRFNSTDASRG